MKIRRFQLHKLKSKYLCISFSFDEKYFVKSDFGSCSCFQEFLEEAEDQIDKTKEDLEQLENFEKPPLYFGIPSFCILPFGLIAIEFDKNT